MKPHRPSFTPFDVVVAIVVVAISAFFYLQVWKQYSASGRQAAALNDAKGIALALRLYAADHKGSYPTYTLRDGKPTTTPVTDSNAAFAQLFPTYIDVEQVFWLKGSAFCSPAPPGGLVPGLDNPDNALKPGANEWACVLGLNDGANPSVPLIADGFADAKLHTYVKDTTMRGGVWSGLRAIVINADNSGQVRKIDPYSLTVTGPNAGRADGDIFTTANSAEGWLQPANTVVNPK